MNAQTTSWTLGVRFLSSVGLSFVLAGCAAVGPDYQQPEVTLPDSFSEMDEQSNALFASSRLSAIQIS